MSQNTMPHKEHDSYITHDQCEFMDARYSEKFSQNVMILTHTEYTYDSVNVYNHAVMGCIVSSLHSVLLSIQHKRILHMVLHVPLF